jgi:hypothetical protein
MTPGMEKGMISFYNIEKNLMERSKIVIVTWSYWSGKTTLLKRLVHLFKDHKSTVLIFDFVKRVEETLQFWSNDVNILPLWCASCDDTTLYAQQITQRAKDVEIVFVEIPADKINIWWVVESLKIEWYIDIDLIWVDRDWQKNNWFETANLSRAWIIITAVQADITRLLWNWYTNREEDWNIDTQERNHIAWWLLKPIITTKEVITFFNKYKKTITRLKWQMYDATVQQRYDIAYATGEEYITFTPTQKQIRTVHIR